MRGKLRSESEGTRNIWHWLEEERLRLNVIAQDEVEGWEWARSRAGQRARGQNRRAGGKRGKQEGRRRAWQRGKTG